MAGHWASSFVVFMDRDGVQVHNASVNSSSAYPPPLTPPPPSLTPNSTAGHLLTGVDHGVEHLPSFFVPTLGHLGKLTCSHPREFPANL